MRSGSEKNWRATSVSIPNSTSSGAKNAIAIAMPPRRGITRPCTRRPPGRSTAPTSIAKRRTSGVATHDDDERDRRKP